MGLPVGWVTVTGAYCTVSIELSISSRDVLGHKPQL